MTVKGKILLVEDDKALVELLLHHFRREEFEVRHTPDGEEALILARESTPDLVILDWMLDSLSGIEVCRQLRRLPATANVPIIMLTARGEEGDRLRGFETGADDYVTKPFSPRELMARVTAVLRRARPALAGELLVYADLEMDVVSHKVRRSRRNSVGPSGCSIRSGAMTARSSCARSTSTSGASGKRSTPAPRPTSSVPCARRAMLSMPTARPDGNNFGPPRLPIVTAAVFPWPALVRAA